MHGIVCICTGRNPSKRLDQSPHLYFCGKGIATSPAPCIEKFQYPFDTRVENMGAGIQLKDTARVA